MPVDASNRPRPATGADVARRAGVSRATVSYILNSTPGFTFSQRTRDAVLQAAAELAYRPNIAARSLAAGSGILVIVVPHLPQSEFTARIAERLLARLTQRGMMCTLVHESPDAEALVRTIAAFQPRAAVFLSTPGDAVVDRLDAAGITALRPLRDPDPAAEIGARHVAHLVARGRSALAFATAEPEADATSLRHHELADACATAGIAPPVVGRFRLDGVGAAQTIREWRDRGIDGVCAYNDDVALAVLFGVREAGLRCPADIAVIGVDGISAGAVAYPPLTTIAIDPETAADWLVSTVLERLAIEHDVPDAPERILTLVVRAST